MEERTAEAAVASISVDMKSLAAEFAQRANNLPFVESVWAGYSAHLLEIWTIIQEEVLDQYLSVAGVESEFLQRPLPFLIDFHTTSAGPDLPRYIPSDFTRVA